MSGEIGGKERVEAIVRCRLEPEWMCELRLAGWDAFAKLPDVRWEKSDIAKRRTGLFAASDTERPCPEAFELESYFGTAASKLVFANERKIVAALHAMLAEQGVLFGDLSFAVRLFPHLVKPYLGQLITPQTNKWVALNSAHWTTGVLLYVPKNVHVTVPLQAWWHRTVGGGQLHPRLLVVAEENSDVTLLTGEVSQLHEPAFSIHVSEVYAKRNARVRIASIQEHDANMTRLAYLRAHVEQDAQVDWTFADVGQGYSIAEATSVLQKDGARSTITSVALGHGSQHLDLTHRAHHIGRFTDSRIRGHAILADQAKLICRAVSQIEKGAVGTNSTQEERMMLLSHTAHAQPIPMLLISEEDVKCDHAVSVGKIPPDQLFYLMSRGLTEREAKRLLLRGFLAPLVDALPIDGLQKALEAWTERKIPL
ncbi:MAG: Fe-S cluster assembly protein SufD [Tumebacillaceae bacterium]